MNAVATFNAERHEYALNGVRVPSITQLLKLGGLVDDRYYTQESRDRGIAIHEACCDFDLGVDIGDELKRSPYAGHICGYMAAMDALKPSWELIEVFDVHPALKFGGRPDRVGRCYGQMTICEVKSGGKIPAPFKEIENDEGEILRVRADSPAHQVQTALQAILLTKRYPKISAAAWQRLVVYLKPTGKFSVEVHEDRRDFDTANRLLREFCL